MNSLIYRAWADYVQPLLQRPNRVQAAALCYRPAAGGGVEVLLATSLTTKRWIVPKGWPIDNTDLAGTARTEAWEETGVVADAATAEELGDFRYEKRLRGGQTVTCEVKVFAFRVERMDQGFPETGARKLVWTDPETASGMVEEPGLAEILRQFARNGVVRA
ncbi:MAG: NUDIX hydrolase [Minwuia sp.]|uniref:NUDIX hydrolase n=1 Tax=Minwuia sp. TaxID=2493630 RepID=UPI003A8A7928